MQQLPPCVLPSNACAHLFSSGLQQNLFPIKHAIHRRVDSLFPSMSAAHGALVAGRLVRGRVAQGRAAGHWPPSHELWSCPGAAHQPSHVSPSLGLLWIQHFSAAGSKGTHRDLLNA